MYGDVLVVSVATDENVCRFGKCPVHRAPERLEMVRSLRGVDVVILGEDSPADLIMWLRPDVIYLGHDQKVPSGVEKVARDLGVRLIRARQAYKGDVFKTTNIKERIRNG